MPRHWTDDEIRELIALWPTNSVARIAKRLRRSTEATRERARRLIKEGVLGGTIAEQDMIFKTRSTTRSIRPELQDFEQVKRDYGRKHHIPVSQLRARLGSDDRLTAELYRLAQAAKLKRLGSLQTAD